MRKNIFYVLISLFLFIGSLSAQETARDSTSPTKTINTQTDTVVKKNPAGAMLRSVFVPGLGQFYNGKWFKGIVIAGVEVGLITNAVVLNHWANEAQTQDERYFYLDNRNLSFWLLGATILYSMADAYVDAHLSDFDDSPELSFFLKKETEPLIGITSSALMMQLSFRLKDH